MRSYNLTRLAFIPALLLFFIVHPITVVDAQESIIDWRAVSICDRMSDMIGDLNSCSFTVSTVTDVERNHVYTNLDGGGLLTRHRRSDVYFMGHNKLMVDSKGDGGHQTVRYDGYTLSMYSYTENNYITVDAPDSTIAMIYEINARYGVEFPAADFFNPHFTDDLIETMNSLQLSGRSFVAGKPAYHIVARNDDMNVEIWISDDSLMLPVKMRISYLSRENSPRHEITLTNWKLNPDLPMAMFDFTPPPNGRKISAGVISSN